ncbi:MAG: methyltransferase [Kineosporiaceae bacterium]
MPDLLAHPFVARVDRPEGEDRLVVTAAAGALAAGPPPGPLVAEHLDHWSEVYDLTYAATASELAGWRASDTGEALPADHMAQWADRTAELILSTGPRVVLELGCGTGMLMRRLHPHVVAYVGTDIAPDASARLAAETPPGARVVHAAAHEARAPQVSEALAGRAPDCVVLNSVTQCFPSVSYLAAVLREALAGLAPGGAVVVGDMRHAGLLDEFARWAGRRPETDEELLIDPPTLAAAVAGAGPGLRLTLHAKTLTTDTELARYRFDAVLRTGCPDGAAGLAGLAGPAGLAAEPDVLAWGGADDLLAAVRRGEPVRVTGIPNRLLLPDQPGAVTGAELRSLLAGTGAAVLLDPDDPTLLAVAAPAAAGALAPAAVAGPGHPHEPLAAFARGCLVETARRLARRGGWSLPATVVGQVPTGGGHAAGAVAEEAAATDRAGRLMVGAGEVVVNDAALARLPAAVAQLDAIALQALAGRFTGGRPVAAPRHEWIVGRWEAVLGAVTVRPRRGLDPDGPLLDRACADLGYPADMARFFREALHRLPELLSDEVPAQALLFPGGDLGTSLSKDRLNVSNAYLHGAVGHVLARAAATRPAPLRVLELGAGAGGGTGAALDGLAGADVDYRFTDVSRFFLDAARERFGDRLRYAVVDVDRDLGSQGVPAGGADVVLAVNVLHCARHVGRSLRHLRPAVAPGGLLLVAEATREHPIVLATMQFLLSPRDGEDPPGSSDARAGGSVFLGARAWRAELAAAGFRTLLTLPDPRSPLSTPAQSLFVATPV